MKTDKQNKIVSDFFKVNPTAKACHLTEDGEAFANKSYADLHANTGKKKLKVVSFDNKNTPKENTDSSGSDKLELKDMKQAQLKKVADAEGVDITGIRANAKIVLAIQAKRDAIKDSNKSKDVIELNPTDLQKLADDLKVDVSTLDSPEKIKKAQEELKNKE